MWPHPSCLPFFSTPALLTLTWPSSLSFPSFLLSHTAIASKCQTGGQQLTRTAKPECICLKLNDGPAISLIKAFKFCFRRCRLNLLFICFFELKCFSIMTMWYRRSLLLNETMRGMLPQSGRAAVTKWHPLDRLSNRNLLPHSYGGWKSETKISEGLVPSEDCEGRFSKLFSLVCRWLCSMSLHIIFFLCMSVFVSVMNWTVLPTPWNSCWGSNPQCNCIWR